MIACVQRCSRAEVRVAERGIGSIGAGLLVLLGVEKGDDEARADALAERLLGLRIFEDGDGKMNRSAHEVGAELLIVSQFTLVARLDRGRRPSFDHAAPAERARALVERLVDCVRARSARAWPSSS